MAIELHKGHQALAFKAFEPEGLAELMTFADMMAHSEMLPETYYGKAPNIVAAIIAGREVGLTAWQSLQSIAMIKGRATMWGDAVLGLVRAHPVCTRYREKITTVKEFEAYSEAIRNATTPEAIAEANRLFWRSTPPPVKLGEDHIAVAEATRRDQDEPVLRTFSIVDAITAGLYPGKVSDKGPSSWAAYPQRMLQMRARSWCLRDAFPDVLRGLAVAEEVSDYPESAARIIEPGATRAETVLDLLQTDDGEKMARPLPDISKMLKPQIASEIAKEARLVRMPDETLKQFVPMVLEGAKLARSNALRVIEAIRSWTPPIIDECLPCDFAPEAHDVLECRTHPGGVITDDDWHEAVNGPDPHEPRCSKAVANA